MRDLLRRCCARSAPDVLTRCVVSDAGESIQPHSWLLLACVLTVAAGCGNTGSVGISGSGAPAVKPPEPLARAADPSPRRADPWARAPDPWASAAPDPDDPHGLAQRACPIVKAPYLFAVEHGGKTSYLLGTHHVGVSLAKMPALVRDKLEYARVVATEVSPNDGSVLPTAQTPVSQQLSASAWRHYRELVGDAVAQRVDRMGPFMASVVLDSMFDDRSQMLDDEIAARAVKQGKHRALETGASVLPVVTGTFDVRFLRAELETTRDRDQLKHQTGDDLAAYCNGEKEDSEFLAAKDREAALRAGVDQAALDRLEKTLLEDRNRQWLPAIETMCDDGDAFIAVGEKHLFGDRGVIALLQKAGYRVARVRS